MSVRKKERRTMAISPTNASRCRKKGDFEVCWEGCVVEREAMLLANVGKFQRGWVLDGLRLLSRSGITAFERYPAVVTSPLVVSGMDD